MAGDEYRKTFEDAKSFIRKAYGLELSLIEQVRLKNDYVKRAADMINSFEDPGYNGFSPYVEAATTFLSDYYGFPAHDLFFLQSFFRLVERLAHR